MARKMQICRKTTKKVPKRNERQRIVANKCTNKQIKDMLTIANSGKTKAIKKSIKAAKIEKRQKSVRIAAQKQETIKRQATRKPVAKISKDSKLKSEKNNKETNLKSRSPPKIKQLSIVEKRIKNFSTTSSAKQEKKVKGSKSKAKQVNNVKSKSKPNKITKTLSVPKSVPKAKVSKPKRQEQNKPLQMTEKRQRRPSRYIELREQNNTSTVASSPKQLKPRGKKSRKITKEILDDCQDKNESKMLKMQVWKNDDTYNQQNPNDIKLQVIHSVGKSIEQLERLKKNRNNRNFLRTFERKQNGWELKVMNKVQKTYTLNVSNKITCNCVQFRSNQTKKCPQICFLFDNLVKDAKVFSQFNQQKQLSAKTYQKVEECLSLNLKSRISEVDASVDASLSDEMRQNGDKFCAICFEEKEIILQQLGQCEKCQKNFHQECLSIWKKIDQICPLCKKQFVVEKKVHQLDE